MLNLHLNKLQSSTLLTFITGLILVSSFGITNLSPNNQAFATLEGNNNKIADSIKKACPDYEGSGNLNGLVTDILKACIGHNNQPPTTPGPNTEPTNFDKNIMDFLASAAVPGTDDGIYKVIVTDKTANKLNSYTVIVGQDPSIIQDRFIIPVSDQFVVNVNNDLGDLQTTVDFSGSTNCTQINATACSGIMADSPQKIQAVFSSED